MADLPEDDGWVEGVRAIEETDPVRFDIYNKSLSALASRTKYLQENTGQSGGVPVEWIEGSGERIDITTLSPGCMYILDVRGGGLSVYVYESTPDIPVGSEFHFVCAGPETDASIEWQDGN